MATALKASWGKVVAACDDVPLYFLFAPASCGTLSCARCFDPDAARQIDGRPVPCGLETSTSSTTWCPSSSNWAVITVASRVVTERYNSGWGKPAGHLEAVPRACHGLPIWPTPERRRTGSSPRSWSPLLRSVRTLRPPIGRCLSASAWHAETPQGIAADHGRAPAG
jgi:hypothetical protein